MTVVVPDSLHDVLNAKLDAAFADAPADAVADRAALYEQLLAYFDEFGFIPDFTIVLREKNSVIGRLRSEGPKK
jgi:hypothetical protein